MILNNTDIQERLQKLVDDSNRSITKFAKDLDLSDDTVRNILSGKTKTISAELIGRLSLKYFINKEWFLTGKGEPYVLKIKDIDSEQVNEEKIPYREYRKAMDDKDFIIEKLNKIIEQQQSLIDRINSVNKG